MIVLDSTSSLFDCFVLLALYDEPASLGMLSSLGRGTGMFEGLSVAKLLWARPFGVPLYVPVADMLAAISNRGSRVVE